MMPKKAQYEIVETRSVSVESEMPVKIRAVVRPYRQGGYLWLPKEWGGKTVEIALVDDDNKDEVKKDET